MPPMTFRGTKEELQPIEDALFCFLQSYAAGVPNEVATSFDALNKCLPESNGCLWRGAPDMLTGLQALESLAQRLAKLSKIALSQNELKQLVWVLQRFEDFRLFE